MPKDNDGTHPLQRQTRDNWVDQAIRAAQDRGEFDRLPGEGKPLDLTENPFGADRESRHRVLKNAGFAPEWIELDKAIRAETSALTLLRDRTAQYLRAYRTVPDAAPIDENPDDSPPTATEQSRLRLFLRRKRAADTSSPPDRPDNNRWLETETRRARDEYLKRMANLDLKVVEFNSSLPADLWWKARPRLSIERAEREFDTACPAPTASDA